MTDFIVVPQTNQWQKLKALVLDSVSSPITKRVYNLGLDEFIAWYGREPRPGFGGNPKRQPVHGDGKPGHVRVGVESGPKSSRQDGRA
jgi:hypothetical protein